MMKLSMLIRTSTKISICVVKLFFVFIIVKRTTLMLTLLEAIGQCVTDIEPYFDLRRVFNTDRDLWCTTIRALNKSAYSDQMKKKVAYLIMKCLWPRTHRADMAAALLGSASPSVFILDACGDFVVDERHLMSIDHFVGDGYVGPFKSMLRRKWPDEIMQMIVPRATSALVECGCVPNAAALCIQLMSVCDSKWPRSALYQGSHKYVGLIVESLLSGGEKSDAALLEKFITEICYGGEYTLSVPQYLMMPAALKKRLQEKAEPSSVNWIREWARRFNHDIYPEMVRGQGFTYRGKKPRTERKNATHKKSTRDSTETLHH